MRWLASLCVLLCACSQEQPAPRRADSALSHQALSRSFRVGGGELVVIELPVQSGRRVEWQRCYLWKGASETLTCPTDSVDAAPVRLPDDPPGPAERY